MNALSTAVAFTLVVTLALSAPTSPRPDVVSTVSEAAGVGANSGVTSSGLSYVTSGVVAGDMSTSNGISPGLTTSDSVAHDSSSSVSSQTGTSDSVGKQLAEIVSTTNISDTPLYSGTSVDGAESVVTSPLPDTITSGASTVDRTTDIFSDLTSSISDLNDISTRGSAQSITSGSPIVTKTEASTTVVTDKQQGTSVQATESAISSSLPETATPDVPIIDNNQTIDLPLDLTSSSYATNNISYYVPSHPKRPESTPNLTDKQMSAVGDALRESVYNQLRSAGYKDHGELNVVQFPVALEIDLLPADDNMVQDKLPVSL